MEGIARDFVDNYIRKGDECVHVRKSGNTPIFKRVTVMEVHSQNDIEIFTEGNSKNGRTYGCKLMKIF